MRASNLLVTINTRLPIDDEGERLFALYETSSAKEITTRYQLLYPSHILPHETYIQLVGDLRAIRVECNDNRRAIAAHHRKTLELPTLARIEDKGMGGTEENVAKELMLIEHSRSAGSNAAVS
jgi:hypothetical protein